MVHPINVIDHPICLAIPERRAPSAWMEHTPFAMWLTSVVKPTTLVELGTHYGTSYCAFCQGIDALGLPTRAFAVDTWEGDLHSGEYSGEVLEDLRLHHDSRYGQFSSLLKMTFEEALSHFADKEIDLLHIDGYHTYEVVRHDYETWRPKVSDRGIILFHDVEVRDRNFGVWRLWEELTAEFPSFTFLHEHGLGVLAPGPDVPDEVRTLLDLRGADIEPVRAVFHQLGRRVRVETDLGLSLAALSSTRAERDTYRAHGDTYRSERDIYRSERDAAGAERDTARAERDTARAERDAARAESVAARAEAVAARAEAVAARAEADAARAERDIAYAERDAASMESHQSLSALQATEERLGWVQGQWDELRSSQSWRAFHQMYRLGTRMAPDDSHRRWAFKRIARLVELLGLEGAIGLTRRQARQAIDRRTASRGRGVAGDRL